MPLCSDFALVNANHREGEISALRCKRWSCSECNPRNRWKVIMTARDGLPNLFLTLTVSDRKYDTFDEQARDMKRGLVLLRRQIADKWGVANIPFIVVFERHKRGQPHMHLLLRGPYMEQAILLAMWRKIMGSGGVNIKFVKRKTKILYYITKYIGKDLAAFEGCKRWWRSQNFNVETTELPAKKIYGAGYYMERGGVNYLRLRLAADGMIITELGRDAFHFRSARDFYQSQNYRPPWADGRLLKPSLKAMAGA